MRAVFCIKKALKYRSIMEVEFNKNERRLLILLYVIQFFLIVCIFSSLYEYYQISIALENLSK